MDSSGLREAGVLGNLPCVPHAVFGWLTLSARRHGDVIVLYHHDSVLQMPKANHIGVHYRQVVRAGLLRLSLPQAPVSSTHAHPQDPELTINTILAALLREAVPVRSRDASHPDEVAAPCSAHGFCKRASEHPPGLGAVLMGQHAGGRKHAGHIAVRVEGSVARTEAETAQNLEARSRLGRPRPGSP